jgi:hypothetical protein
MPSLSGGASALPRWLRPWTRNTLIAPAPSPSSSQPHGTSRLLCNAAGSAQGGGGTAWGGRGGGGIPCRGEGDALPGDDGPGAPGKVSPGSGRIVPGGKLSSSDGKGVVDGPAPEGGTRAGKTAGLGEGGITGRGSGATRRGVGVTAWGVA